ncbi:MAG: BACON domain-containing protein, partial [Bryobacterales bacterium]|nr:BACON domain-containing protein [Bryobacterales bacterium]
MPLALFAFLFNFSFSAPAAVTLHSASTMAVQPVDCNNLPPAVSAFAPSATAVYLVFVVSGHKAGDVAAVEYVSPGGAVYAAASGAWAAVTAQEETAARFCFYDDMFRVAGAAPATMPGQWTIRILYNRALLSTLNFTIAGAGGGGACSYSLSPATATIPASGGVAAVSLATGSGCAWNVSSNASWIIVMTGSSGTGAAVIGYQALANTSGAQREGVITVNGQTHTVTQAGSASGSCTYTLSAASAQMAANGGTGSVVVTAGAACQWNASVNAAWIRLTASSGTGTATIAYQVEANTSVA